VKLTALLGDLGLLHRSRKLIHLKPKDLDLSSQSRHLIDDLLKVLKSVGLRAPLRSEHFLKLYEPLLTLRKHGLDLASP
jgi:hypothetical protein